MAGLLTRAGGVYLHSHPPTAPQGAPSVPRRQIMSDHKFDRLLSEIRNEPVDEQVVSQAAKRVWSSIAGPPTAELSMHKLRSCEDFQTLIPEYLGRNLPEAPPLLFAEHGAPGVPCRHP